MTNEVPPVGNVHTLPASHESREPRTPPAPGNFAQVLDLSAARLERRGPRIPREAIDEIAAAARLYDELASAGLQVRFDLPPDGGRITAQLSDIATGAPVRELGLREVIDPTRTPPTSAA